MPKVRKVGWKAIMLRGLLGVQTREMVEQVAAAEIMAAALEELGSSLCHIRQTLITT